MSDLLALTRENGVEYGMYTLGSRRYVIKGRFDPKQGRHVVQVRDQATADKIARGEYGKWSGHTHPPSVSPEPGPGDRPNIPAWRNAKGEPQKRSGIWSDRVDEPEPFYRQDLHVEEQEFLREKQRMKWRKLYRANDD